MKTTGLLLLIGLAVSQAQVHHRIAEHRYLWQVRDPFGLVIVDDRETLDGDRLTIEKYERGNGVLTQALTRAVAVRVNDHQWQDTLHEYIEWRVSAMRPVTNRMLLTRRGVSWEGSSGVGVWQTQDGHRYLQVNASAFDLFWTAPPTICLSNGVDQGVTCISAFRHQAFPVYQSDVVTLASAALWSLPSEAGEADRRHARIKLPIDPLKLRKFVGRGECYYCANDRPCWFWEGTPPIAAASITLDRFTASITMPAPSGLTVDVWRTKDLANWECVGRVHSADNAVQFTDTNAPARQAFYRWEESAR